MLRGLVLSLVLLSTNVLADDALLEAKIQAAERYLEATPVKELMADMASRMAQSMSEKDAKAYQQLMLTHFDIEKIEQAMIKAMAKSFSLAEINAIADFYSSPVGKSAMKKFGGYMAQVQPTIMLEVQRAMAHMRLASAE